MSDPLDHIAAWESAGLIDPETAARLRAATADTPILPAASGASPVSAVTAAEAVRVSSLAAVFGPGLAIGEMFGYLGAIFILAAWTTFAGRTLGPRDSAIGVGIGAVAAAIALAVLGSRLSGTGPRGRRAAGLACVVFVVYVAIAATSFLAEAHLSWPELGVVVGAIALGAAVAVRIPHPALLTQAALLAATTGFAGTLLLWIQSVIDPDLTGPSVTDGISTGGTWRAGAPDPIVLLIVSAIWWLGVAVVLGLVGLRESRSAQTDPAAGWRAALTRLWAGLVAVLGLASAVTRSGYTDDFQNRRVLEPWVGEVAIVLVCAVLVERAFRRGSGAFVYAAGVGLIYALTDLNVSYLSHSTEIALLIEGLVLLGAGVASDRLRRQVARSGDSRPLGPPQDPPLAAL